MMIAVVGGADQEQDGEAAERKRARVMVRICCCQRR